MDTDALFRYEAFANNKRRRTASFLLPPSSSFHALFRSVNASPSVGALHLLDLRSFVALASIDVVRHRAAPCVGFDFCAEDCTLVSLEAACPPEVGVRESEEESGLKAVKCTVSYSQFQRLAPLMLSETTLARYGTPYGIAE